MSYHIPHKNLGENQIVFKNLVTSRIMEKLAEKNQEKLFLEKFKVKDTFPCAAALDVRFSIKEKQSKLKKST